jgi:hypothetical protein
MDSPAPNAEKITKRNISCLPKSGDRRKVGPEKKGTKMRGMSHFNPGTSETGPKKAIEAILKGASAGLAKTIPERIESIATTYGLSYYQIAQEMGVTRTTVHAVRKHNREATRKFILKLEAAEKRLESSALAAAGKTSDSLLIFAINSSPPAEEMFVAPDEVLVSQKGTIANPNPDAAMIKLTPPSIGQGIKAIIAAHIESKNNELLALCLPAEFASNEWIENMSPSSYLWALQKSVILILGPNWKLELTRILANAQAQNPKA